MKEFVHDGFHASKRFGFPVKVAKKLLEQIDAFVDAHVVLWTSFVVAVGDVGLLLLSVAEIL